MIAAGRRKNLVGAWTGFGGTSESAHTTDYIDDVTWSQNCGRGSTSQWYYRLVAIGLRQVI